MDISTRQLEPITIDKIALVHVQVPVRLLFSYGQMTRFNLIIVKITANGVEGLGEGLIHPDEKWELWLNSWSKKLINSNLCYLDNLLPVWSSHNQRSICEAFSMALHDVASKIAGFPFYYFIGGKRRQQVPLMACMFPQNPDEAKELASEYIRQGVKALKVKLIGNFVEDLSRIKAIRSIASEDVLLQGDANEGYKTINEAEKAVKAFGTEGLNIFEDPLKGDPEAYSQLRQKLQGQGASIMLDVLTRDMNDLVQVLRNNAADILNFHASEMGSITSLLKHIHLAESFGIPFFIGGTGFAAVGSAAYQHIAAAVSSEFPAGELGGYFDHGMPKQLIRESLIKKLPCAEIPDTPGIGVCLDDAAVKEFEVKTITW
jgi:D-galactarolactone cycloisomerase